MSPDSKSNRNSGPRKRNTPRAIALFVPGYREWGSPANPGAVRKYLVPVALVVAAVLLTMLLRQYLSGNHFLIVYAAVALSAWLSGRIGGLIATFLGIVSVYYVFIGAHLSLGLVLADVIAAVVLLLTALLISSFRGAVSLTATQQSRKILEGAQDAFIVIDSESRIRDWNAAAERIFGWRRNEVIGRFIHDTIIPVQFQEGHRKGMVHLLATGEGPILNRRLELTALRRDGEEFPVELTVTPLEFDGKFHFSAFLRDITESKEATAKLEAERRHFSALFEAAPEGIAMVDRDDRILRINSEFTRMFGYTSAAAGQQITRLIVPPELREESLAITHKVAHGETLGIETTRMRKDGTRLAVSVLATPCDVADGQQAVYVIYRDITERKRNLNELQSAMLRFRSLIENASDMVSIFDVTGRRLYASPATERTLGYTEAELLSEDAFANVHPDDIVAARTGFAFIIKHPDESASLEFRYCRKDGEWRLLSAKGRNLLADPAVDGIVINSRDITDERELEDQLRKSQRMDSIGRLAGGIAHDFNNLLTIILSYTDLILADGKLASEHRADFGEIKKASERAALHTRQLLAFGRGQTLKPAVISVNEQVTEILPVVQRLFDPKIEIHVKTAPDLWSVKADPGQIQEVLLNLALNARDAMSDGGVLSFSTENRVITEKLPHRDFRIIAGDYVVLSVEDSGEGMDDSTAKKIFEPFFTTKELGKGTGLGLATVYGIIKQSGGYIQVRSSPGAGTKFDIYLQRVASEIEKPAEHEEHTTTVTRRSILLVEDEAAVRRVMERILEAEGHTLTAVTNGADALSIFRERGGAFDLLITDLLMPTMGGRELVMECRKLRPDVKVAYVSGYNPESAFSPGMPDENAIFITKPFTRNEFAATIARALASSGE